jgi:stage V sporulation protein S
MQSNDSAADYRDSEYDTDEGLLDSRLEPRVPDRPARPIIFGTSTIKPRSTEVLKVSTRSRPSAVAGAIAGVIRDSGSVEVQSIGAGATNQAIKAVAIARSYLSEEGVDIVCIPSFIDVAIDSEERTAIRLLVQHRGA